MDILEFRKKLQQSQSKIQIITDRSILSECEFRFQEFTSAIKEILNDNEKEELLKTEFFQKFNSNHRLQVLNSVENSSIRASLLKNARVVLGFSKKDILDIIKSLNDVDKKQMLYDFEFLENYSISSFYIKEIIETLSDEYKKEILNDKDDRWKLSESDIAGIVSSIESEEIKTELIGDNNFKPHDLEKILKTFSDETKKTIILLNKYNLSKYFLINIIASMNIEPLVDFVKNNKAFLREYGIMVYQITKGLDEEKQLAFLEKLEEMNLSIAEKRLVLATLKKETKNQIDSTQLSHEYASAIEMEISEDFSNLTYFGNLIVDLYKNLEEYRGLDDIMAINALGLSSEQRGKLIELCGICPRMEVRDKMPITRSTGTEYIEGEKWIEFIESGINLSWSQIQKIAYIDNAIGKKISYSPDFATEVFNR